MCVCVCVCVYVPKKVEGSMGILRNVSCLASYEVTPTEHIRISVHLFYAKTRMLQHNKTKLIFCTTLVLRLFVIANGLLRGSVISERELCSDI